MTGDHGERDRPPEEGAEGGQPPGEGAEGGDGPGPPDRRALVVGAAVALVLAVVAGSAFGLLPGRSDRPAASPEERATERAVATLPAPEAEPEPLEDHFPAIDGLESVEVDEGLVAGLEERLRPAGDYAATRHREFREAGEAVAVISLLRAEGDEGALAMRREALEGLGRLFDTVSEAEIGGEDVVRGASGDGTALLWLPDTDSVLVVSAIDRGRAEAVLSEVVGAVRGVEDEGHSPSPSPEATDPAGPVGAVRAPEAAARHAGAGLRRAR